MNRFCVLAVVLLAAVVAQAQSPMPTSLYKDPQIQAAEYVGEYSEIRIIADQPQCIWLDENTPAGFVEDRAAGAAARGEMPCFVSYAIPHRDIGGGQSSGGAGGVVAYLTLIQRWQTEIGNNWAMVMLEPDSLGHLDPMVRHMSEAAWNERLQLLWAAVEILVKSDHNRVYLDGTHPDWLPTDRAAARLFAANIQKAHGFVLNTSNFRETRKSIDFGRRVLNQLDRKHGVSGKAMVIDTSRNGKGPWAGPNEWCNPPGRALGEPPTLQTGEEGVDAFLWIKRPGESDGDCNDGKDSSAGEFLPVYAVELVRNTKWAMDALKKAPAAPTGLRLKPGSH